MRTDFYKRRSVNADEIRAAGGSVQVIVTFLQRKSVLHFVLSLSD